MIKTKLTGSDGENEVDVIYRDGVRHIPVLTEGLKQGKIKCAFLTNDTNGANMAINAAVSGTPEGVHDGTDSTLWTGSQITGSGVTFTSTARPNNGTKSVQVSTPVLNDVWQFAKGSDLTVSNYESISFYVNVDKGWDGGDSVTIYGWDTTPVLGGIQGNAVPIENYFSQTSFDVWQQVIIPLSDMGLNSGTVDALRMSYVAEGSGQRPTFYLDDIQFEESGGNVQYDLDLTKGRNFYLNRLIFSIADTGTGGTAKAYNQIGALASLTSGISLMINAGGKEAYNLTLNQLSDMLDIGFTVGNVVDDGTDTYMTVTLNFSQDRPLVLNTDNLDELVVTLSDDLSGLLLFKCYACGWEEN